MRRFVLPVAGILALAGAGLLRVAPGRADRDVASLDRRMPATGEENHAVLLRPAIAPLGRDDAAGASAGAATEEEIVELEEIDVEDLPPDPLETGDCALTLSFYERGTAEPFGTRFDLWRLGAPGNADWTAGDQKHATSRDVVERATLENLPEGRYRVHLHGAREGAEDPPAFAVSGGHTTVAIDVDTPTEVAVHVRVFDAWGGEVTSGRWRKSGYRSSYSSPPRVPSWVERRMLTGDRVHLGGGFGFGCGSAGGRSTSRPIEAGPSGFLIGTYRQATRYRSQGSSHDLFFEGRSSVGVDVHTDRLPARPLVAVVVSLEALADRLRLSDGRRLYQTDLRLVAACDAAEVGPDDDPWRVAVELPIEVKAMEGRACVASGTIRLADREVVLAQPENDAGP